MKKYFLSFTAIAIAGMLVAFAQPKAKQADKFYFEFDGVNQTYSKANVENESNTYWKYIGKNLSMCTGDEEKACRVAVLGANVDNTTTPTELRNVVISADQSGATAHITGITESGSLYSNQED